MVKVLASWDIYATLYLLLTWLAFRRRGPAALREVAATSRRRRLADRLFASPPAQVSQGAAAIALVATVIVMPQARSLGKSSGLVFAICIAFVFNTLILAVSVTIVTSYIAGS